MGTAKFEHDFSPGITMRSQARYANYARNARITEAKVTTSPVVLPDTPLGRYAVTRNQIAVDSGETFLENQTDVIFTFRTGFIRHKLVTGMEAGRETSDPIRFAWTGVPNTSLLHPDTGDAFTGTETIRTRVNARTISVGSYALDTLRLGQRWELTGGVRVDRFDADLQTDSAYTAALQPGGCDDQLAGGGSVQAGQQRQHIFRLRQLLQSVGGIAVIKRFHGEHPPEENKTYEVGTKWDFLTGKLSFRAAGFRTDKNNAREPAVDDPTLERAFRQPARQRRPDRVQRPRHQPVANFLRLCLPGL